ncbi:uncharacterized protein MELLADRAFT_102847 [Melampsora larici-populina 98AG31]|uniref:RING-type domain-containing protein n=1 Tax=Melampsora larici-populina (strain 98AG31 / pathotype 3-4-7) TaxID=747676 RepID=F4R9K7_MELLP|nr:uncharacterized protein MELLADRAFT_102847 [Melampsora larici-populina 98AG31]EGG10996.1 hypothetical protein MELLADRAFT_102847 [Melampsora larici-populina 98AG31]
MAPNPNAPNDEYKKLVEQIYALQKSLDQAMTDPHSPRLTIQHIKDFFTLEAELIEMLRLADWQEESSNETSDQAQRTITPNLLRLIADSLDSKLSPDFELPNPGAKEWYGILVFVTLLSDCSHPVTLPPNPEQDKEDGKEECSICITKYEDGQRYIEFPCHTTHKICEEDFALLAASLYFIACPFCRKLPFNE